MRSENEPYPFSWLDEVTEITLNPEKTDYKTLTPGILEEIKKRLLEEVVNINRCIKTQVFYLYRNEKIKVAAGHYDQAIRLLQSQARSNLAQYPKSGPLRQTGELLLNALNELSQNVCKRYSQHLPPPLCDHPETTSDDIRPLTKIQWLLSADQIGILIRSAFDAKVITGDSFRKVCQAIAPYVSTPWKTDISWDTIRSNSGRPEQRDKEIAIQMLGRMIEKIKEYR